MVTGFAESILREIRTVDNGLSLFLGKPGHVAVDKTICPFEKVWGSLGNVYHNGIINLTQVAIMYVLVLVLVSTFTSDYSSCQSLPPNKFYRDLWFYPGPLHT